ncbi:MAG TPA: hypothetical protein VGE78_07370 [Agromyces sp.]
MPLSQPARVAGVVPVRDADCEARVRFGRDEVAGRWEAPARPVGLAVDAVSVDLAFEAFAPEAFAPEAFGAADVEPEDFAGFAGDADPVASRFALDRGTREPAGFAGLRGVREDSPFIVLLMTARKTTTGAATRPPPSRCRYAITP